MEEAETGCGAVQACAGCGWRDWDRCSQTGHSGLSDAPCGCSTAKVMLSQWKQEFAYVGRHLVWGRRSGSLPALGS